MNEFKKLFNDEVKNKYDEVSEELINFISKTGSADNQLEVMKLITLTRIATALESIAAKP